ncbi:unnamed protein product [Ascophyllum nodosum]
MAHDTSASVRARYVPVSGDDVTRGAPSDGMDYIITVDERRKWWWEGGPVDSCCLCFTLEVGIVIMAGLRVAANCFALLMHELDKKTIGERLVIEQTKYIYGCTGDSPTLSKSDCHFLEQDINFGQNFLSSDNHASAIAYDLVYIGLLGLAGGVVGLWAGCGRSTMAAKLFFWSMLAGLSLCVASSVVSFAKKGHFSSHPLTLLYNAVYFFLFIYFTKVAWSYYAVLKARHINTSSGFDDGVELGDILNGDERSDETA